MTSSAALVSLADRVHNARAIVADLHCIGVAVFERFSGCQDGTLRYYQDQGFCKSRPQPLAKALARIVEDMIALSQARP